MSHVTCGLQHASDKWRSTWTSGHPSSCQALLVHHDLNQVYCIYLCVNEHSWLASSVSGRLMGLICPTALCVRQAPRPCWRTWVKEWIIDSDKALRALIAAGELDYLFKVPSLGKGESYQWSPDWPHIVLLWTCSGRAKKKERERRVFASAHLFGSDWNSSITSSCSLRVHACPSDTPGVSNVELSRWHFLRVFLFLEITNCLDGENHTPPHSTLPVVTFSQCRRKLLTFSLDEDP